MQDDHNNISQTNTDPISAEHSCVEVNNHKTEILTPQNTMDKPCACGKQEGCSCGSEDGKMAHPLYVYAIGKVVHRFPTKIFRARISTSYRSQA